VFSNVIKTFCKEQGVTGQLLSGAICKPKIACQMGFSLPHLRNSARGFATPFRKNYVRSTNGSISLAVPHWLEQNLA
jgi:hypothetical protein